MTDLRKNARGRMCMVRIPGVCNWDQNTTVLAHIRRAGSAGVGQKPPDIVGVWACSDCHDAIDGRRGQPDMDTYVLDALVRQLLEYHKEGTVKW